MPDLELDELKRQFLDEAREKVAEMESALLSPGDGQSVERLAYLAHQLKGSGGSYGFQTISSDAAAIEKALEEQGVDPASEQVRHHLERLRAEVERRAAELG